MSNQFKDALGTHKKLQKRIKASREKLLNVTKEAKKYPILNNEKACIYVAGSLGRLESGKRSDLDIFMIADDPNNEDQSTPSISRLEEYEIFASLIRVNETLQFPKFSGDGRFLKVYELKEMLKATGSPRDDSENLFTARMLLILESHYLTNDRLYEHAIESVASHYFRDRVGKKAFTPLFLLNDVLRYWRTLCLNYEEYRHDRNRPWWKKNLNLKFSRKLTVYSMVLALLSGKISNESDFITLSKLTPIQRMSDALDEIEDPALLESFHQILNDYELFLTAKENGQIENRSDERKTRLLNDAAVRFGNFFHDAIDSPRIDGTLKRYLII
jgi:hypothetical protein